ncbi:MAG: hypothetical protein KatS3mg121_0384 [Gammaproteobacteria bacterium]|nr:MAG: hypothetical protein KatS3mg121_0384 [Gammaproteobacteria bacterium]
MRRAALGLLALALGGAAGAEPEIRADALYRGKALLWIDGRHRLFAVGDRHDGVRLLAADPERAVIEYRGRRRVLGLSPPPEGQDEAAPEGTRILDVERLGEGPDWLDFALRYERRADLPEPVILRARILFHGRDTRSGMHAYTRLPPGRGRVRLRLMLREGLEGALWSDAVRFEILYNDGGRLAAADRHDVPLVKPWRPALGAAAPAGGE